MPYVSQGIFGLSGFSGEEVRNNPGLIFANIHPDDLGRIEAAIDHSSKTLEQWTCDYRILTKTGSAKWVRGISRPQPFEGGVRWFGFMQEIEPDQARI
jgi:PAS domain-containing protein